MTGVVPDRELVVVRRGRLRLWFPVVVGVVLVVALAWSAPSRPSSPDAGPGPAPASVPAP